MDSGAMLNSFEFRLPQLHIPQPRDLWAGFVLLALPQIPLSIGNSLLATAQATGDLFPGRGLSVQRIGFTYGLMNVVSPFLSGVPIGHGSGGLARYYTFGARTGGSVIIYGSLCLFLGLFVSHGFARLVQVFPLPILGVILLFEGLALLLLSRDTAASRKDFAILLLVGLMAGGLPYGYVFGLVAGTAIHYLLERFVPEAFLNP
jgi:hypothetical protein